MCPIYRYLSWNFDISQIYAQLTGQTDNQAWSYAQHGFADVMNTETMHGDVINRETTVVLVAATR